MNKKLKKLNDCIVDCLGMAFLVCGLGLSMGWISTVHAGNVSVKVDHRGNLIITGDKTGNCVRIMPIKDGTGRVESCDETTFVKGGTEAYYSGANNDFKIKMRGGNNEIYIIRSESGSSTDNVRDTLEIKTGKGHDKITLNGFSIGDDLKIYTHSGNDRIMLDGILVNDDTKINTGAGNDQVIIDSFFLDEFTLKTKGGTDFVELTDVYFGDDVQINLGKGNDSPNGIPGGLCIQGGTTFDGNDVELDGGRGRFDTYTITTLAFPFNGILPIIEHFEDDSNGCPDSYLR